MNSFNHCFGPVGPVEPKKLSLDGFGGIGYEVSRILSPLPNPTSLYQGKAHIPSTKTKKGTDGVFH